MIDPEAEKQKFFNFFIERFLDIKYLLKEHKMPAFEAGHAVFTEKMFISCPSRGSVTLTNSANITLILTDFTTITSPSDGSL